MSPKIGRVTAYSPLKDREFVERKFSMNTPSPNRIYEFMSYIDDDLISFSPDCSEEIKGEEL